MRKKEENEDMKKWDGIWTSKIKAVTRPVKRFNVLRACTFVVAVLHLETDIRHVYISKETSMENDRRLASQWEFLQAEIEEGKILWSLSVSNPLTSVAAKNKNKNKKNVEL